MNRYLSEVDESDIAEIVDVIILFQESVSYPGMKALDAGIVPFTDEYVLHARRADNTARSRVHTEPNLPQIRFKC